MSWRPRFRPGAPDGVFGIVLLMGLIGGRCAFLNDPGTFWHARLGRDILRTGSLPHADGLTFTRLGASWLDMHWGFDVVLALVVDHWGWSGAVAATAVVLAWIYAALARWLIREGASPFSAAIVSILAAAIGSIHFLTRPHLFTFAFVLWTLRACRGFHDRGDRAIWSIPFVMVAWANGHGGFLAGPLIVATAGVGHAASGPLDAPRRRRLLGFATVFLLACLAPLVNPYGLDLYRHVAHLLVTSRVTDLIVEYQPAPFGTNDARVLEWVILSLIALPVVSRRRPTRYDLAQMLVWLHMALVSIRHAPLFAMASAPGLACLIDGLISSSPRESGPIRPRWSAWPVAASLGLGLAAAAGIRFGGHDPGHWPLAALPALDREPTRSALFHEQDWGGLIEERCRPARLAFLDDRFELWGRAPIIEYVEALQGGPTWDLVRDRNTIGLVWVRPDRGLARRLLGDSGWEVVHRDALSILFRRRGPAGRGETPEGGRPSDVSGRSIRGWTRPSIVR